MAEDERRIWLEEAMNRWETSLLRLCFAYLGDRETGGRHNHCVL